MTENVDTGCSQELILTVGNNPCYKTNMPCKEGTVQINIDEINLHFFGFVFWGPVKILTHFIEETRIFTNVQTLGVVGPVTWVRYEDQIQEHLQLGKNVFCTAIRKGSCNHNMLFLQSPYEKRVLELKDEYSKYREIVMDIELPVCVYINCQKTFLSSLHLFEEDRSKPTKQHRKAIKIQNRILHVQKDGHYPSIGTILEFLREIDKRCNTR